MQVLQSQGKTSPYSQKIDKPSSFYRQTKSLFRRPFILFSFFIITLNCMNIAASSREGFVSPKVSCSPVPGDADDPAIWINEASPADSWVIGTDKKPEGALYVWDLKGKVVYKTPRLNRPTNVDVRSGIDIQEKKEDIVVTTVRGTNELKVYKVDYPKKRLLDITAQEGIPTGFIKDSYGLTLYKEEKTGRLYAFVSSKQGGDIHGIYLWPNENGQMRGDIVARFGKDDILSFVEGMVTDDRRRHLYCADEDHGLIKYHLSPGLEHVEKLTVLAKKDGIVGDREGVSLYECPHKKGYLLLSNQESSNVKIYQREGHNAFVGTLETKGATKTDGIASTSRDLGPAFPEGILVAHNDAGKNFVIYDWKQIRQALDLPNCFAENHH